MKRQSIRKHFQPYSILNHRKTTINHAFASALAPHDVYDDAKVSLAIEDLGQDPDADLVCFYCEKRPAETWDHIFGLVREGQYAGFGHVLGNLVPCCKECNSEKGNKEWREFLEITFADEEKQAAKIAQMQQYLEHYLPDRFTYEQISELCLDEVRELDSIRTSIFALMKKADKVAEVVRHKVQNRLREP